MCGTGLIILSYHQVRLQYPDGGNCYTDGGLRNQDQGYCLQHRGVPGEMARHEHGQIQPRVRTFRQHRQPSGEAVIIYINIMQRVPLIR